MALYQFENRQTGEKREVHASMKSPPPEKFVEGGVTWHRVYTNPRIAIKDAGGVRHPGQELPISRSLLPRDTSEGTPDTLHGQPVVKYRDGCITTTKGEYIIRDKDDARRAEVATGTKRIDD